MAEHEVGATGNGVNWAVIAGALWGLVITLMQVIALRHAGRVDKLASEVDAVKSNMVTWEDFNKSLEDMKSQRREMHEDNKTTLKEVLRKFEDNAAVERDDRHAMRGIVGELTTKVAVLADRIERYGASNGHAGR